MLRNDGQGTLGAPAYYSGGSFVAAFAVLDVTRDGFPDVVAARYGPNELHVLATSCVP